jgi:enoyl-CoA hydratase
MGGGFALALGADIRLAAAGAKFNVQMIRIGMTGGDVGISYALPRAVGQSIAAELMLTGDFITAERGERVGLVSGVYKDPAEMAQMAAQMAGRMLQTNPDGLRFTKECLRLSVDMPSLEAAMAVEDRQQMLIARSSREHKARVSDFANKRETDTTSGTIFHDLLPSKL